MRCMIGLLSVADAARAAAPQVPVLWDAKERLPKPDLSAMPRLRFLTTTDFPPFNFLDGSGKLSGFHIDLARAICAELGIVEKCQIQALPWAELEGALQKGEGEAIIAGYRRNAGIARDLCLLALLSAVSGTLHHAQRARP